MDGYEPCGECFAMVENKQRIRHNKWHRDLSEQVVKTTKGLKALADELDRRQREAASGMRKPS